MTAHRASTDADAPADTRGEGKHRGSGPSRGAAATAAAAAAAAAPLRLKPLQAMAGKGLYCVWDVTAPAVPVHVLAAPGQATAVC